jgi:hypothetical protein
VNGVQSTTAFQTVNGTYRAGSTASEAFFTGSFNSETLGSTNLSVTYKVEWEFQSKNYAGDPTNCGDDGALVTVSFPTGDFTTGGGFIYPTNNSQVNGANAGVKTQFSIAMKYNSRYTNLNGNFNTIIRRGTKSFLIKSNNPQSLLVDPLTKKATLYYGSVVIQELGTTNSIGNNTAVIKVTDNGEPGGSSATTPDAISIVVKDRNGNVWYSNTPGPGFAEQAIGGGNIQVRTGSTAAVSTMQAAEIGVALAETSDLKFGLKAFPNPTASQFSVNLQSSNTADKITLRVFDAHGRIIDVLSNLYAGQTVQIGSAYRPGIYFVEMLQGNNRKQLKLLKSSN